MLRLDYAKWWNGNGFVTAGQEQKTFDIIDEPYTTDWEAGKEFNKKINFSTSNSRDILVRIYQPYNLDMQVNKITQKIPGKFRTVRRIKKYFDELINEYKSEKKELEFYIGDLPTSYDNATDLFLNGLFLDSDLTELTGAWPTDSFIDVVADRIVNHLGKNGWILTGTFIFKHTIPFRHIIREIGRDEWYICKGAEWYLRSNKVKGEWVEINKGDPGTLISEEKIFEDEPQGVKLYNDNRSSFETGDGAAQITIEGLEEGDVQEIVKGTIGTFTGADLDANGGIYIDHGLGFRPVNLALRRQDKKVEDTNMDVADMYSDSQIYLQVYVPYEDETVFTYRVF
jgi:hypothetical protein